MRRLIPVLLAASCALAAGKPNFTGSWKLNFAKSNSPVTELTADIKHNDPEFLFVQDKTLEFKLATDGKEHSNSLPDGTEIVIVLKWDGDVLTGSGVIKGGTEVKFADRMMLAPDGKSFKMERRFTGPDGDQNFTFVFEKQ